MELVKRLFWARTTLTIPRSSRFGTVCSVKPIGHRAVSEDDTCNRAEADQQEPRRAECFPMLLYDGAVAIRIGCNICAEPQCGTDRRTFVTIYAASGVALPLAGFMGVFGANYGDATTKQRSALAKASGFREMIRNASLAPSGHNTQPWRFSHQPGLVVLRPISLGGHPWSIQTIITFLSAPGARPMRSSGHEWREVMRSTIGSPRYARSRLADR